MDKEFDKFIEQRVLGSRVDVNAMKFFDKVTDKAKPLLGMLRAIKEIDKEAAKETTCSLFSAVILILADNFDEVIEYSNEIKKVLVKKEKEFNKSR